MLHRLENEIQRYAWGSTTSLAELYGIDNPDGDPMAELWMGAHPKAPSRLRDDGGTGLDAYLDANAEYALGPVARSHGRLPFLFKILCAQTPLSIQAHPSLDQAREGFAREEAAGIDRGAPDRNYRDDNHKPELICAITPFWALRGFRRVEDIRDEWTTVEFRNADAGLEPPASESDLGRFFSKLLQLPDDEKRELIAAAFALARGRWDGDDIRTVPEPDEPLARYLWVLRIADEYPGDIGILSPLILNVMALRPGQVTFQPAGVLHAYLQGTGAELMANSDNVLRGGMTPKHIDPEELQRVGVFRTEPVEVLAGQTERVAGGSRVTYETPFDEFAFDRLVLDGDGTAVAVPTGTPQILFCHRGTLEARCEPGTTGMGSARVALAAGEAAFVDAATTGLEVRGTAELFVARVP
jgi:mannose-6-phosphate isomerase